jgi:SAM-dependent MidA family methyltransferase
LRYVLVERSDLLRARHADHLTLESTAHAFAPDREEVVDRRELDLPTGPIVVSLAELPRVAAHVVFANELLDNLPFGIAEWDGRRWSEVRVGMRVSRAGSDAVFEEVLVPIDADFGYAVEPGTRVPIPRGLEEWWRTCEGVVRHGFVVVIDYTTTIANIGAHPWLRTYREHAIGGDPLDAPGEQDITADVVLEQLEAAAPFARVRTDRQADWLAALGIDELVAEGRSIWEAGADRGDIEALAGRSRVSEAAALCDRGGLGAHHVVLFASNGAAGRDFAW